MQLGSGVDQIGVAVTGTLLDGDVDDVGTLELDTTEAGRGSGRRRPPVWSVSEIFGERLSKPTRHLKISGSPHAETEPGAEAF
jgi:hypothetical protein